MHDIINRPSDIFGDSFVVKAQSGSYAADLISDAIPQHITRSFLSRLHGIRLPGNLFLEAILTHYAVCGDIISAFGSAGGILPIALKDGNGYRR